MKHDAWFDTEENKALMAICARKLISNIGIGGIVWGIINIGIGVFAISVSMINVGILILGVMMLGTGVQAMRYPTLKVFLTETAVTVVLFLWNVAMMVVNLTVYGNPDPRGVILPLIIAVSFASQYRKLRYLKDHIASIPAEKIKATKEMCKQLVKQRIKNEPMLVETGDRKCRVQLMDGGAFFIQRDLMRAFVALKKDIQPAVEKPGATRLKLSFGHPLGKLTYKFDRKNSDKLKAWMGSQVPA